MTNQTLPPFSLTTEEIWGELDKEVGKLSAALSMMTHALRRASMLMREFSDAMRATSEETDTPS
jgi:hypothetical protein